MTDPLATLLCEAVPVPPDDYHMPPEPLPWGRIWRWAAGVSILLLGLAAAARAEDSPAPATPCGKYGEIRDKLTRDYGEEPVTRGLNKQGIVVEIWSSQGGRTWSAVMVGPNGQACMFDAGRNLEVRQFGTAGDGA